ncbi:hypothetical protein [Yoonia sp.]|uniref:hypothetical protein n=1 Tax=Yoonia sp. TaxID=2212373 RepID=UPI002E00BC94|nr:hypothetical protein [Yoonia sp.]
MARVLHAGFHKTGSTYLQKFFFPKLENVLYLRNLSLGKLPLFEADNMSIVISNEAACGYPYPNTATFTTQRLESNIDILEINKVLIIEREFFSWVLSLYFQTLNEKATWSLQEFIRKNEKGLLTWRQAARAVEEMCVRKRIDCLIVPYQSLVSEPGVTLSKIANFIDGSSFNLDELDMDKRSNISRSGAFTIAAYRGLNATFNNGVGRFSERIVKDVPRRLMASKLGLGLDNLSGRRLSADCVRRIME